MLLFLVTNPPYERYQLEQSNLVLDYWERILPKVHLPKIQLPKIEFKER